MEETRKARIRSLLDEVSALLDDDPEPIPAKVVPIRQTEEVTGVIGRPVFKVVKGKSLFTAGLCLENNEWLSIEIWGKTADEAKGIERGDLVRLTGRTVEDSYLDATGTMRHKKYFRVKSFESLSVASSA